MSLFVVVLIFVLFFIHLMSITGSRTRTGTSTVNTVELQQRNRDAKAFQNLITQRLFTLIEGPQWKSGISTESECNPKHCRTEHTAMLE